MVMQENLARVIEGQELNSLKTLLHFIMLQLGNDEWVWNERSYGFFFPMGDLKALIILVCFQTLPQTLFG